MAWVDSPAGRVSQHGFSMGSAHGHLGGCGGHALAHRGQVRWHAAHLLHTQAGAGHGVAQHMGHIGIPQGQGRGVGLHRRAFQQSHQHPGQEAVARAHGVRHHHGGGFSGVPGAAIAVQQHGTVGPQCQGGPGSGGQGQQVAGLVQRGGTGQVEQGQVVVTGLDQMGLAQCGSTLAR